MTGEMSLEDNVNGKVFEIANAITEGTKDPYFREAAAKAAIRDLCHALVDDEGPDVLRQDLAEHLRLMADVIEGPTDGAES